MGVFILKGKRMIDRKEAKTLETTWVGDEWEMISVMDFEDRIDEIYDDVESRICENCKHGGKNYYIGDCPIDDTLWESGSLGVNFWCGTFERKESDEKDT